MAYCEASSKARLRFYANQRGINPHNQDVEALYQERKRVYSWMICGNLRKEYVRLADGPVQGRGLVLEREDSFSLFHCLRNLLGGWAAEGVFVACIVECGRFTYRLCQRFSFELAALSGGPISQ